MSRHNRRDELIQELGYCTCDWASPSAHHDCCLNKDCGKVIKTIYEKYNELEIKHIILTKELEMQKQMVLDMFDLNERNCLIARHNDKKWQEHCQWLAEEFEKKGKV